MSNPALENALTIALPRLPETALMDRGGTGSPPQGGTSMNHAKTRAGRKERAAAASLAAELAALDTMTAAELAEKFRAH